MDRLEQLTKLVLQPSPLSPEDTEVFSTTLAELCKEEGCEEKLKTPDKEGMTLAHRIAARGHSVGLELLDKRCHESLIQPGKFEIIPDFDIFQAEPEEDYKFLCPVDMLIKEYIGPGILPSHLAAYYGHVNCLEILAIVCFESLKSRDHKGRTPGYYAVREKNELCLGVLKAHGAVLGPSNRIKEPKILKDTFARHISDLSEGRIYRVVDPKSGRVCKMVTL